MFRLGLHHHFDELVELAVPVDAAQIALALASSHLKALHNIDNGYPDDAKPCSRDPTALSYPQSTAGVEQPTIFSVLPSEFKIQLGVVEKLSFTDCGLYVDRTLLDAFATQREGGYRTPVQAKLVIVPHAISRVRKSLGWLCHTAAQTMHTIIISNVTAT